MCGGIPVCGGSTPGGHWEGRRLDTGERGLETHGTRTAPEQDILTCRVPPPQSLQRAPVQLAAPPSVQGREGSLSGQVLKSWHLQVSSQPLSTPREPRGDGLCVAEPRLGLVPLRQNPHLGLTQQQAPPNGPEPRDHRGGPAPVSQLGRVLNALRVGAP